MRLPLFIARRYFFSRHNRSAVNIISGISVIAFGAGTAALVIVLSVFNGFESLVKELYSTFDAELRIEPATGKFFDPHKAEQLLKQEEGVALYAKVLEENILLQFGDQKHIATIKGVDPDYLKMQPLGTHIIDGKFYLGDGTKPFAAVGAGVAYQLGLVIGPEPRMIEAFVPRTGVHVNINFDPSGAFNQEQLLPTGIFAIEQEIDNRYIMVALPVASRLLEKEQQVSAIELGARDGAKLSALKKGIQEKLGPEYLVKDRAEQHPSLYRVMRGEKWAVYLMLCLVLLIAGFNMTGSLSMLIYEKRLDSFVLVTMGLTNGAVRKVFLAEGMLITFWGASGGLLIGLLIAWLQQQYGLIRLGGMGTFVVEAYPVDIRLLEIAGVYFTALLLGLLSSYLPLIGRSWKLNAAQTI